MSVWLCEHHAERIGRCLPTDEELLAGALRRLGFTLLNGEVIDADDPRAVDAVSGELIERGLI